MILIEKRIELSNKLYIDSWYDRFSKNYITQVKDNEDNEIDYAYSGDAKGRNFDIQMFKDKYKDDIVEYYQSKKKKKKQELPMTGLSPILPDKGKGINTFNKNASPDINVESGGEVSGGSGE